MNEIVRYFSQNGEDHIINEFFESKKSGFFIDIGAFDGVHLSNSYCFELMGWGGICIEPQKYYFDICEAKRPGSKCVKAACCSAGGIDSLELKVDETGLFSGLEVNPDQPNISGHYESLSKPVSKIRSETVAARTLDSILHEYLPAGQQIDFLSLDVEGAELDVLHGFDLARYAPRIMVIEANGIDQQEQLDRYLLDFGYKNARKIGPNLFYVLSETDFNKIDSIEDTCLIEKQVHPLGSDYTQRVYLEGKIIFKGRNGNRMLNEFGLLEERLEERMTKVAQLLENMETLKQKIRKIELGKQR